MQMVADHYVDNNVPLHQARTLVAGMQRLAIREGLGREEGEGAVGPGEAAAQVRLQSQEMPRDSQELIALRILSIRRIISQCPVRFLIQ